ncbi:phage terminase small subunit [Rhodococcoides fascians]|uniref:phage terminase small subunit n=1 Tax=Rhodococcoides fascians TaxID=1828 RepID=UPI000569735A|nr:hypothetical protein [Rhodococcus fascians]
MAGRGSAPKDASKLAGHGAAKARAAGMRVITAEPTRQPNLPVLYFPDEDGKKRRFAWPEITKTWWGMWRDSPLSDEFTATDWSELLDTALLHARFWSGEFKLAGELRLRVAKFGATPEDRARLRIQFAMATQAEERVKEPGAGSSRARRGPLKAV